MRNPRRRHHTLPFHKGSDYFPGTLGASREKHGEEGGTDVPSLVGGNVQHSGEGQGLLKDVIMGTYYYLWVCAAFIPSYILVCGQGVLVVFVDVLCLYLPQGVLWHINQCRSRRLYHTLAVYKLSSLLVTYVEKSGKNRHIPS